MQNINTAINNLLDKFEDMLKMSSEETQILAEMFNALVIKYYEGERLSYCHWQIRFDNNVRFNLIVRLLTDLKWIKTVVANNYATIEINEEKLLEYVSTKELADNRMKYLVDEKVMRKVKADEEDLSATRMPSLAGGTKRIKQRGNIVRPGFRKSGNYPFKYDTVQLAYHLDEFHYEITKGLELAQQDTAQASYNSRRRPLAKTDYREIVKEVFNHYMDNDNLYTLGNSISDGRGRASYMALSKVGNPISSKLFRSILCMKPEPITEKGILNCYRAIADMAGMSFTTVDEKVQAGQTAYKSRVLSNNLFESIWLERLYNCLDKYYVTPSFMWDTPIEIDVNSSMMTNMAVLLNDHDMMRECNLIAGQNEIFDPWFVPNVARRTVKKALTPILYGSSAKLRTLLADDEGEVDFDELMAIQTELETNGKYKSAVDFRDFILQNCNTKVEMDTVIGEEEFTIYCNRFAWEESDTVETFNCFDSDIQQTIPVTRAVKRVPNTTTFNLYMVTLLLFKLWRSLNLLNCWNAKSKDMPISREARKNNS